MTQPLAIVVLISGSGTNLAAIIKAIKEGLSVNILKVISTNPNAKGLLIAQQAQIPCETISPSDYPTREDFDAALSHTINMTPPELIVLAGFMRILTASFIDQYHGKIINIHPSLLPKYKGLNTFQRALDNNDTFHGSTVHFVIKELDAGANIGQAFTPILPHDTIETLTAKTKALEHQLLPYIISLFATKRLQFKDNLWLLDNIALPNNGINFNEIIANHSLNRL